MFGLGALSPKRAARRGLEGATSERYRAENPEEFERIVDKRLSDSPSSYYAQALAGSRFDDSGEVGQIGSPTLVIHGAEDRYVPRSNARAEAIPDARLRILEGRATRLHRAGRGGEPGGRRVPRGGRATRGVRPRVAHAHV